MDRNKKRSVVRKVFSTPNVPSGYIARRRMTKPVERILIGIKLPADSDLQAKIAPLVFCANPGANFLLLYDNIVKIHSTTLSS